ncbi:MAG TPA: GyrI-like domain-containing protein [Thermoleophilia bacterium]|nr:GyrI-like domain-containing protein [Thermoleophilia bacterium]
MRYEVEVVGVPEQTLAVLGGRGAMREVGARMRRLRAIVAEAGLVADGPLIGRFYEETRDGETIDYDVCLAVAPAGDGSVPDRIGEARGELVPAHHTLATRHIGRRDQMDDAVAALHEALDAIGYRAAGPLWEVYVAGAADGLEPADFITDLRLPYAR